MPYRRYARKKVLARRKKVYRKRRMMGYRRRPADRGVLEKVTRRFPLTVDATGL